MPVRDLGSKSTVDSCVSHHSHCGIQPWALAAHLYCGA